MTLFLYLLAMQATTPLPAVFEQSMVLTHATPVPLHIIAESIARITGSAVTLDGLPTVLPSETPEWTYIGTVGGLLARLDDYRIGYRFSATDNRLTLINAPSPDETMQGSAGQEPEPAALLRPTASSPDATRIEPSTTDTFLGATTLPADIVTVEIVQPEPMAPSWVVHAGETLREALARWCDREDTALVWDVPIDYTIDIGHAFEAPEFRIAVNELLAHYRNRAVPLAHTLYANHVLRITRRHPQ